MIPMQPDRQNCVSTFTHLTKRIAQRWCTCAMSMAVLFALTVALPAQAQHFQLLYQFPLRKTGNTPSGLLRVNGNFYGTTAMGGMSNEGTVFELTSQGTLTERCTRLLRAAPRPFCIASPGAPTVPIHIT